MKIGNVKLDNNIVLSPMAGVTDLAFRLICKEMGAGLVVSEMVSSKGIYYGDKKTEKLMEVDEKERPIAIQIFGSDPDIMASVVKDNLNNREDIDIIDVNMGCPAPKIVKNGDGSALLKKPKLVGEILESMVKVSKKPITLKMRIGWDSKSINGLEIAKIAENSGVSAIIVHGRTREMHYSGIADWDYIGEIKKNVKIPVIGNGDIFTPEDAIEMIERTKCDGIALGRGVKGNPWLINRIFNVLQGKEDKEPTIEEIIKLAIQHLYLTTSIKGEKVGALEMRKHLAWYLKGQPDSSTMRDKINKLEKVKDMEEALWDYYLQQSQGN